MRSNILPLVLFLILMGCGHRSDDQGIVYNSKYLSVQPFSVDPSYTLTQTLYSQDTNEYNQRSNENIVFVDGARVTTIGYGTLESGLLGLTECQYQPDGSSNCKITINQEIDPDVVTSIDVATKKQIFIGVLRHELGHAFGLGHIKDNSNNVMYPYFSMNQLQETNVALFFQNLTNWRLNGPASGLPDINTK